MNIQMKKIFKKMLSFIERHMLKIIIINLVIFGFGFIIPVWVEDYSDAVVDGVFFFVELF
jgi:hypothetical protein